MKNGAGGGGGGDLTMMVIGAGDTADRPAESLAMATNV